MLKRFRYIILLVLIFSGTLQVLAQLAMPDQICVGTTRSYWVNSSSGSTFTWKINGVMQSYTTGSIDINWSVAGTFKVEVQEHQSNCNGDIQSGLVTVFGIPALEAQPDMVVCNSFNLPKIKGSNLSGNEAYYDNSQAAGGIRIFGPITESQTVWIYDKTGTELNCSDQISFKVEIFNPPQIFAGNAVNNCSGTILALLESTAINYSSLLWTSNGDGLFDDPVALHPVYTPGPNDIRTGNATLILTAQGLYPEANCPPVRSNVRITIHTVPYLVITDPPAACVTETVDLGAATIVAGSDPALIYTFWKDETATTILPNHKAISTEGIYYIKATNAAGCSVVRPVAVTFSPVPKLVINNPDAVCKPATVDLGAVSVSAGSEPGLSFSYWQDATTTATLPGHKAIAASGIYYITATSAAGCSVTGPVRVLINEPVIPVFNFVKEFCQNSVAPVLESRSDNDIIGSWNPSIISTVSLGKTKYIFTPDAGQCASNLTIEIEITNKLKPIFSVYNTYCQKSIAPTLPAISINGIPGSWFPAVISTSTPGKSRYQFTPDAGQCGDTTSIVIRITDPVQTLFSRYSTLSLCRSSLAPVLPAVSDNGVRGTWLPAIISTDPAVTKTYNFTPDAGQCAKSFSSIVAVIQKDVPIFDGIGPLCLGSLPPVLPVTSKNGIIGTWIPSEITTITSGKATYLFKPNTGVCAEDATLKIEIYNKIELGIKADPLQSYGGTTKVTVTAKGGSGIYTSGTGVFNKGAGTHTFTVTDDAGCSGFGSIVVANPQDLVITTTVKPVECISGFAVIEVTATGGTPPYRYSIAGSTWSTGSLFIVNASAIPYQFEVIDMKGLFGRSQPIQVTDPPLIDLAVSSTSPTCVGGADGTATVVPTEGMAPYYYLWNDPLKQRIARATGLTAGTYTVEVSDVNGCNPVIAEVTVSDPPAMTLAATGTDPICPGTDGSIRFALTNVRDGNYDILYDAGKFSSVQILSNTATVAASGGIYNNLKLSLNGCSTANGISVSLKSAPEFSITEVVTQPTCQMVTGRMVVTSPKENTGFIFSIDNGPYQVLATFPRLNSGSHMLKVKGSASGCESKPKSIVIQAVPSAPAAPTASVTVQPNCSLPTGTIVTTAPKESSGFEYRIDGGTYQQSATFTGLKPGTHQLKVRALSTGCESGITTLTVNPAPEIPTAPTASVTVQPNCTYPNGIIAITAPRAGTGYEYCLDGNAYQVISTFAGLTPGSHQLKVRTLSTGCESGITTLTVNPAPEIPTAPTASVTVQPNCTYPNGIIAITAPRVGTGYEYCLDGNAYQIISTFAGLIPGSHQLKVRTLSTGCESGITTLTVNPAPEIPTAPTASVTVQPNCIYPNGIIAITAPRAGTGYEYCLDGNAYQAISTFAGLTPGSHQLKVRSMTTNCESGIATLTVNPVPDPPSAPVATVTVHPTCIDANGTAVVSNPKEGTGFEYNIDGAAYQASGIFKGLMSGEHIIRVKQTDTGCESGGSARIKVNAVAPSSILKFVKKQDSKCFGEEGSISFEFANVMDGIYTITYEGGQFKNVNISNNMATIASAAGIYNKLSIESNGCNSGEDVNVVITQPDPIVISESVTEIDFKSQRKGAINLAVSGGSGKFSFKWSNRATTSNIKNLSDGTYSVWITDENNCSVQKSITIRVPNFPSLAVDDKFFAGCLSASGDLLENDSDPENDLFFPDPVPVEYPLHGAVTLKTDGSFDYVADKGFTGIDVFRYAIYDVNHYLGDTASVFITINSDLDCDGVPDNVDPDADGDGIPNVNEAVVSADTDGDGILNYLDVDSDNDGIVDNIESQSTAGYILPSDKDSDGDGIDDAYDKDQGGIQIIPIDTDLDGVPDYLDADSDNDLVPDYIEGHDENADGKPDQVLTGKDSDADGLDDGFDTVNRHTTSGNLTGSNAAMQNLDGDSIPDWRDDNDDNDAYLTRFEDLNTDGDFSNDDIDFDGHPEYLDYGRECDLFIPNTFSPNNDNIHDYFQIYCINHYPNARIYIFDSKGNKIYEKDHYGNLEFWGSADRAWWNGKTDNRSVVADRGMVPTGIYYYVLKLGNGEVKKSFVFVSY